MDIANSLTGLFYNILPGAYVLIATLYVSQINMTFIYSKINPNGESLSNTIIFLSLSLFVGFIFQGLTKFVRIWLDDIVYEKVITENNTGNIWKKATELLKDIGFAVEKEENKHVFYLMDNYINSSGTNKLPSHFSARTSLWANLVWANLILMLSFDQLVFRVIVVFILIFSAKITWMNLKSQQDTILKSFLMEENNYKNLKKIAKEQEEGKKRKKIKNGDPDEI